MPPIEGLITMRLMTGKSSSDTNITLSIIADLEEAARESMMQTTAAQLHWWLVRIKQELWRLHKQTGDYMSEYM